MDVVIEWKFDAAGFICNLYPAVRVVVVMVVEVGVCNRSVSSDKYLIVWKGDVRVLVVMAW